MPQRPRRVGRHRVRVANRSRIDATVALIGFQSATGRSQFGRPGRGHERVRQERQREEPCRTSPDRPRLGRRTSTARWTCSRGPIIGEARDSTGQPERRWDDRWCVVRTVSDFNYDYHVTLDDHRSRRSSRNYRIGDEWAAIGTPLWLRRHAGRAARIQHVPAVTVRRSSTPTRVFAPWLPRISAIRTRSWITPRSGARRSGRSRPARSARRHALRCRTFPADRGACRTRRPARVCQDCGHELARVRPDHHRRRRPRRGWHRRRPADAPPVRSARASSAAGDDRAGRGRDRTRPNRARSPARKAKSPAPTKPGTTRPDTAKPGSTRPDTAKPGTTRPGGAKPASCHRRRRRRRSTPRPAHARHRPRRLEPTAPPVEVETPEPTAGRLVRLRARLSRSQNLFGKGLLAVLSRDQLDDDAWEELEDTLIGADVGVDATREIVERLRSAPGCSGTKSSADLRGLVAEELVAALDPDMDRSLKATPHDDRPGGRAGRRRQRRRQDHDLRQDRPGADRRRPLGGARRGRHVPGRGRRAARRPGPAGSAPRSSGARRAATRPRSRSTRSSGASRRKVDSVLIDTAGRLQNKVGLMDELGKVKRVIEKHGPVDETLLILDATTGQNGLEQARVFTEVGRRDRRGADEARRHREGRHRDRRPAQARHPGQAGRPRRRARTTSRRSTRRRSWTRCWASPRALTERSRTQPRDMWPIPAAGDRRVACAQ